MSDKTVVAPPSGMSREQHIRLLAKQLKVHGEAVGKKLTFAAVAKAAGGITALIHNYYPDIAEYIRELQGKSSRAQRDKKHEELVAEREKSKALRKDVRDLQLKLQALASINETLIVENTALRTRNSVGKVVALNSRKEVNRYRRSLCRLPSPRQ